MKLIKPILVNDEIVPAGTIVSLDSDIDVSLVPIQATDYRLHTELNQVIWNYDTLKPEIRERLIDIANDFYESSGFKADIKDIIFTGSLANYNYHDGSDIDLHVVIDYSDENEDTELVKLAANAIKWKWNKEHNITINGYEVETYIQDANEPHTSSGIYSVMNDTWIVKPVYHSINVDTEMIRKKSDVFKFAIDDIEKQISKLSRNEPSSDILDMIDTVRYKVLRQRKDAFANGEDEFSVGNLVFKELRNSGYIEKLMNLEKQVYDTIKSFK